KLCYTLPPSRVQSFCSYYEYHQPAAYYTLSLHDALPIPGELLEQRLRADEHRHLGEPLVQRRELRQPLLAHQERARSGWRSSRQDRKSTRLNSSHVSISYAVFCLKKKTIKNG